MTVTENMKQIADLASMLIDNTNPISNVIIDEQQFKEEFDSLVSDLISCNTDVEIFEGYTLKKGGRSFRILLEIEEY